MLTNDTAWQMFSDDTAWRLTSCPLSQTTYWHMQWPVHLDGELRKQGDQQRVLSAQGWGSDSSGEEYITMQEVGRHNLAHDAWVVVEGKVFE